MERPPAADVLLAVGVAAAVLLGAALNGLDSQEPNLSVAGAALLLVSTLPVAFRRRAPVLTLLVTGAAASAYGVAEEPDPLLHLGVLVAGYTVVVHCAWRTVVVTTVVGIAAGLWSAAAAGDSDPLDYYTGIMSFGLVAAVGLAQRSRLALHEEERRRATAEERARIARELHDVVAHHVSMIVVQAEAGASVADERSAAYFDAVASTGRRALTELRRLLGVLREGPSPLTPQPGVDRLPALVEEVRDAGVPVELRIEGEAGDLPPAIDLSAYRIVQEALTNTMRHAGPASATVVVRYRPESLEIEVTDDGRGGPASGNGRGGHGLVGIRERVALCGGALEAGPAPDRGFRVVAKLPLA